MTQEQKNAIRTLIEAVHNNSLSIDEATVILEALVSNQEKTYYPYFPYTKPYETLDPFYKVDWTVTCQTK